MACWRGRAQGPCDKREVVVTVNARVLLLHSELGKRLLAAHVAGHVTANGCIHAAHAVTSLGQARAGLRAETASANCNQQPIWRCSPTAPQVLLAGSSSRRGRGME